jgi:hypothetical protein
VVAETRSSGREGTVVATKGMGEAEAGRAGEKMARDRAATGERRAELDGPDTREFECVVGTGEGSGMVEASVG